MNELSSIDEGERDGVCVGVATTRGRTGFDGDVEAGIAGGGAWPP